MRISPLEEFGLRCLLQLARARVNSPDRPMLSAVEISEREGISVEYVSKLMHLFRKEGFVSATRGARGGFYLSQEIEEISVKHVFDALQSETSLRKDTGSAAFCHHFSGQNPECVHLESCSVRPVWMILGALFDEMLGQLRLSHLLSGEKSVESQIDSILSARVNRLESPSSQKFLGENRHE